MLLRPGLLLAERYEIIAPVGEGGFGTVYHAKDLSLKREVALKLLKTGESACSEEDLSKIKRESKLLARISHPNIVAIYALELIEPFGPIMVMEYLQGSSLKQYISDNPNGIPPQQCRNILSQLCAGLQQAHEESIVHRDLSSNNIILQFSNNTVNAKIIDFGLSKLAAGGLNPTRSLTKTGTLIGNPLYMSPEACRGEKLDARSDIYSLGCILYEMLTGNPIFQADEAIGLLFKQQNEYPSQPNLNWTDKVEEKLFLDILISCLQKDRNKRISSVKHIQEAMLADPEARKIISETGSWQLLKRASEKQSLRMAVVWVPVLVVLSLAGVFSFSKLRASPDSKTISAQTIEPKLNRLLKSLERKERRYGKDSEELIKPLFDLADYYAANFPRYRKDSVKVLNRLSALLDKYPGLQDQKLSSLRLLRSCYASEHQNEMAYEILKKEMKFVEKNMGKDSREYVFLLLELGRQCSVKDIYSPEAEAVFKEAIREAKQLQQEDVLVEALNSLGVFYTGCARHEEALQTLKDARRVGFLALENPDKPPAGSLLRTVQEPPFLERAVIDTLKGLQYEYSLAHNLAEAEETCIQALKLIDKLGDHVLRNETYARRSEMLRILGGYLRERGKEAESIRLFNEALSLALKSGDQIGTAYALMELGCSYQSKRSFGTAEAKFQQALKIFQKAGPMWKFQTDNCLASIGHCKLHQGDLEGARKIFNDTLTKCRAESPVEHNFEACCLESLGTLARENHEFEQAAQYFLESIEIDKKQKPENIDREFNCTMAAAFAYRTAGDSAKTASLLRSAESLAKRLLAREEKLAEMHSIRRAIRRLAKVYAEEDKFDKARSVLESELSRFPASRLAPIDYAWTYRGIAETYRDANNNAKAEEWYEKAVEQAEKQVSKNDQALASYYADLAGCYKLTKKIAEAESYYKKAFELWTAPEGSDFDQLCSSMEDYTRLMQSMNKNEEASKYERKLQELLAAKGK